MPDTRIADNFSQIAAHYDAYAVPQRQAAEDLLAFTGAVAPRHILEPGCGTGLYTQQLSAAYPEAAILGVDISPAMLEIARHHVTSPAIRYAVADIEQMREGSFDLISSNAALQWCTDLRQTLLNLTGMLAADGLLSFTFFGPGTYRELNEALQAEFGDAVQVACRRFAKVDELSAALDTACRTWTMEERTYTRVFPSLKAVLQNIRYTGTRGRSEGAPVAWTPGRMARVEKAYRDRCGEIHVSYQVLFCKGTR